MFLKSAAISFKNLQVEIVVTYISQYISFSMDKTTKPSSWKMIWTVWHYGSRKSDWQTKLCTLLTRYKCGNAYGSKRQKIKERSQKIHVDFFVLWQFASSCHIEGMNNNVTRVQLTTGGRKLWLGYTLCATAFQMPKTWTRTFIFFCLDIEVNVRQ